MRNKENEIRNNGCEARDIAAYLAGELNEKETISMRKHVRSCPECKAVLARETHLNGVLRQALRPRVAPEYWERIWPRVQVALAARRERRPEKWLRWILVPAGSLAAAAGLLVFLASRPLPAPALVMHDASYFTDLPQAPPGLVTGTPKEKLSTELISLSMGNATPSERAALWQRLEEL